MGNQNNNPTTHQTAKAALKDWTSYNIGIFPVFVKIKIAPQTDQITPHNFDQGIPVVRWNGTYW